MSTEDRRALTEALQLLSHRSFSCAALQERLRRKGHAEAAAVAAVRRCREYGYLDDHEYGLTRARELLRRKPSGSRGLVHDLRRQGLDPTMIQQIAAEAYAELGGERAVLDDALRRWIGRNREPEQWPDVRRCSSHLARRGFSASAIHTAMSPWLDELGS